MQKVYILVTTYNRLHFTRKCLESLKRQTYKNFQVIVIDSGSTDGTVEYIEKYFPKTLVIQATPHWWWTRATFEGVNLALSLGQPSDYVLLLNDDCYAGAHYLNQLISTSHKYPKALIGSLCVIANNPNKVVEAGIRINWPTGVVYGVAQAISQKLSYYKNMTVISQLDALPGKGTLIPFKIFSKVGNFDYYKLPHYIADYEFSNRAKRGGYDLLVDTKAILKHNWSATGYYSKGNSEKRTIFRAWQLLFGRKSMNNIVDWFNFLRLSCPKEYLQENYWITYWRILNGILSVWPLYYFRDQILFLLHTLNHILVKLRKFFINK